MRGVASLGLSSLRTCWGVTNSPIKYDIDGISVGSKQVGRETYIGKTTCKNSLKRNKLGM